MAVQSLLLASKFVEQSRIYPAEVVYLVNGWGRQDFDTLMTGNIEEYILSIIEFDLIMLSPADFIEFYIGSWNFTLPVNNCERAP